MDLVTELLVEAHRLQVLSLVRRHAFFLVTPTALARLGDSLRIRTEECWPLIEELIEEGFISPLPGGAKRFWTPLRLTPIGEGYLEWMRRRLMMADLNQGPSDPLDVVH